VDATFASIDAGALAFLLAVWVGSVLWTARDAGLRCANPRLRHGATAAAVVLPILGALLYALLRPCEERIERRARRLRVALFEAALAGPGLADRCRACSEPLEDDFRCCPCCGERASVECRACGAVVRAHWSACPWCAEPLVELDYSTKILPSRAADEVAA
jgi:hypothetical protein